jgi:hypothetical protein
MEAVKQRGNPNLSKAKKEYPKEFRYMLTQTFESLKPVNAKTNESDHAPYPPMRFFPTSGVAKDPRSGEMKRWRYVYGYSSIWLDDQEKPKPTKTELESPNNQIMFINGMLKVDSADSAKVMAVEIQDEFEGQKNKVNPVPVAYRLVNPEEELNKLFEASDSSYEAQKAVRESKFEEIAPVASLFGIDVSGGEENQEVIRKKLILKAIELPAVFLREFVNPKNKIKYLMSQALMNNIISFTEIEGKVVYVETKKVISSVNPTGDVADQLASMVMSRHEKALELYEQLQITAP